MIAVIHILIIIQTSYACFGKGPRNWGGSDWSSHPLAPGKISLRGPGLSFAFKCKGAACCGKHQGVT